MARKTSDSKVDFLSMPVASDAPMSKEAAEELAEAKSMRGEGVASSSPSTAVAPPLRVKTEMVEADPREITALIREKKDLESKLNQALTARYFVRIIVGCLVRHEDFVEMRREEIENCPHVRADETMYKLLVGVKGKHGRAHCPFPNCGRPVDESRDVRVMKHNGNPPGIPFPNYLTDLSGGQLSWCSYVRDGYVDTNVVILGRTTVELPAVGTRILPVPSQKFVEETRALLEKAGALNDTFGTYLSTWTKG